jgi:hypothetical protein
MPPTSGVSAASTVSERSSATTRSIIFISILGVELLVLLLWGWGRWGNVLTDYGLTLAIPDQLLKGKVLHRDIAIIYGPISQYINAIWFALFGVSNVVQQWVNLVLFLAGTVGIYVILRRAAGEVAAFASIAVFLPLFALAHSTRVGNYNFIAPYCAEAAHGTLFCIALIYVLCRWNETQRLRWTFLAGLLLGATFLTKVESFLSAGMISAVALLYAVFRTLRLKPLVKPIAVFTVGALILPIIFLIYFSTKMPFAMAIEATCSSIWGLLFSKITGSRWNKIAIGFEAPLENAWEQLRAWLLVLPAGAIMIALAIYLGRSKRNVSIPRVALVCGTLLYLGLCFMPFEWSKIARLLPGLAGGALIYALWKQARFGRLRTEEINESSANHRLANTPLPFAWALWCAFALSMLARMILHPRLSQYGFVQAMPAFLMAVCLVVYYLPRKLECLSAERWILPCCCGAIILVCVTWSLNRTAHFFKMKHVPYAVGPNFFYVPPLKFEPMLGPFQEAVAYLRNHTPPNATVHSMPEGAMLNYLSGRWYPTPYIQFTMSELYAFGEDNMVAALRLAKPDYVAVIHKHTLDGAFGSAKDYGIQLMQWVREEYELEKQFGGVPFAEGTEAGIQILRRRTR